jgi:hypothetical protein
MTTIIETRKSLENIFLSMSNNIENNQFPKLDTSIVQSDTPRKSRRLVIILSFLIF